MDINTDEAPVSAAPSAAPSAPPSAPPVGAPPPVTPGPALQPPAPKPQPAQPDAHTGLFDKFLSAFGGGARNEYSVDPNTGKTQVTKVQPSRGELARHIIAGALTGLFAGAAEHGPGAAGRAGAEGFQAVAGAEQKRDQQARQQADTDFENQQKALTRQAQLTNFNFQQQIALRNESRLDAEQQEKFATDQNAITEHMDTIGGQRVPVMVNGKDVNAGDVPNNDKDLMQAYVDGQIKAPQGAHLILSTSSDKDGSIIHHVWTVPNAQLDTPVPVLPQIKREFHLPDDVAPIGMSRQLGMISEITKTQNMNVIDSADKAYSALSNPTASPDKKAQAKSFLDAQTRQETRTAGAKAEAESKARGEDQQVVAYDPQTQKNIVMPKGEAQAKGIVNYYKANPETINSTIGGFNDVQTKINQLAAVVDSPNMANVQAGVAAALLEAKGFSVGLGGTYVPTGRLNAKLYEENIKAANQATRDFVTASLAAHEAVTQLPRLQTFGKSSRMTQQQMEAAQAMLPIPGDDPASAKQKLTSLQGTLDPLRKQLPEMPGAALLPSFIEAGGGTAAPAPKPGAHPFFQQFGGAADQRPADLK